MSTEESEDTAAKLWGDMDRHAVKSILDLRASIKHCLAEAGDDTESVTIGKVTWRVSKARAEAARAEFVDAVTNHWPVTNGFGTAVPPIDESPSLLDVHGLFGDSYFAHGFMAIGKVLGLWDLAYADRAELEPMGFPTIEWRS